MPQLADLIRQKNPGAYDDLDDDTLESKVLAKHPEYSDLTGPKRNAAPAALKVENPDVDQRIKEAKDFLAKPSVPDEGISREGKPTYEAPETPRKGVLESFAQSIGQFLDKHPRVQEAITGTSPEFEKMKKEQGITDVQGPGFMRIPGLSEENVKKAAQYVTGSEGNIRLGLGAATKAIGDILATGFDPRATGAPRAASEISKAAGGPVIFDFPDAIDVTPGGQAESAGSAANPVRRPIARLTGEVSAPASENLPVRRSTEIPYRAPDEFTAGATQIVDQNAPVVPERGMEQPENLVPAESKTPAPEMNEEEILKRAREKFGMGIPEENMERPETPTRPFNPFIQQPQQQAQAQAELPIRTEVNQRFAEPQATPEDLYQFEAPPQEQTDLQPAEKPTATHIGTQPGYEDVPETDLYNIEGGPEHGFTVSKQGLIDRGIEVPQRDESKVGKTGAQLRAEALASRGKKIFGPDSPFPRTQAEADAFKEPQKFENGNLPKALEDESVMDYHNRTGASIADSEKATGNAPDESIEPSFARTESGGTRMDIGDRKAMIDIFKNTYSGSVPHVAAKELIQNAIDASAEGGTPVEVKSSEKNHTIEVTDHGKGLTRDEIDTVFTNLSSSGKRGGSTKTIGELGVGKTTYLVAGKHVSVETVARSPESGKLVKVTFNGTPHDIIEGFHPTEEEVPEGTPTGTTVKLETESTDDYHSMLKYFNNLKDYSSSPVPINIEHQGATSYNDQKFNVPAKTQSKGKKVGSGVASIKGAQSTKYTITIPDDAQWGENDRINLILNNRGMFQGVDGWYTGKAEIPDRVVIDLDPLVSGDDNAYPLTAPTRERLKEQVRNDIGHMIDKELVKAQQEKREKEIQRIFDKIKNSRGIAVYNGGERYTPEEIKEIQASRSMRELNTIVSELINELHAKYPTKNVSSYNPEGRTIVRVGFIFDDLRGVNLQNPANTNEIIVMSNPFSEMQHYFNDPVSAAQGIVHIGIHEFTHVHVRSEGSDFTAQLATIYGGFDLEKQIEYRNRILKAITGGSSVRGPVYNPEIEKLLYKYTESRGRPKTSTDILLREAGSYVLRLPERKGSDGDGGESRKGTPSQQAVGKLLDALEEAKSARGEQEELYKAERARRFANFEGVKATGMKGAKSSMSKLSGEYEKVDFESRFGNSLSEKDVDALFTSIKRANIATVEKARGYTALFKLLNGGELPPRSDIAVLDDVFGGGFGNRVIEMHAGLGGMQIKLTRLANTMKAMRSSLDISAPLRQGAAFIHKGEWWSALADAFSFMAKPDYYEYSMHMITKDKEYLIAREAGLFLAKTGDLVKGEEAFGDTYINNIPRWTQVPRLIEASERAYTGFLNELRYNLFKTLINEAKNSGHEIFTLERGEEGNVHVKTSKLTDDIAKMINNGTGRGSLGRFNKIASELNAVIWSPRYLASRIAMLNPKYYMSLDKFAKHEAIKSLLAIAGFGIGITSLSALVGGKVLGNPLSGFMQKEPHALGNVDWINTHRNQLGKSQMLSTDFGKARFQGGNVVDPYTGLQQIVVATARLITGQANGRPQARSTTIGNFAANKLSPAASLAYEVAGAKKFTGNGGFVDAFGQKRYLPAEIANSFVPMFVQDVRDVYRTDPSVFENIGLDAASFFGAGVQQYPETNTQKSQMRFRRFTVGQ